MEEYYFRHAKWLMNGILYGVNISEYEEIMIFFDDMPIAKKKQAMLKGLRMEISNYLKGRNVNIP